MVYKYIVIILILHFSLLNGLEKILFSLYQDKYSKRPNHKCVNLNKTLCLGMPSGHAEIVVILMIYLYLNKKVNLELTIVTILLVCLQRIIYKRHTLLQVIAGIILGLFYVTLYKMTNFSYKSLIVSLLILTILFLLIIIKLDKKLYEPIPEWVDKSMYPKIKEKRQIEYQLKVSHILLSSFVLNQNNFGTFISWKDTEKIMDNYIEKLQKSNIKIDAIVGIKSGGAILSDYISKKMNIKNYKIKLSLSENNCKSGKKFKQIFKTYILFGKEKHIICDGIEDDLANKNVILIDELVASGNTYFGAYRYLKDIKNVNSIYPILLTKQTLYDNEKTKDLKSYYDSQILVWPWGYDN